jgi:hypothetical protein
VKDRVGERVEDKTMSDNDVVLVMKTFSASQLIV